MKDKSPSKKTRTNVPWAVVINHDSPDIQDDGGIAEDNALELEFEAWQEEATDGEPDPASDEAPGEEACETEPKPAVNGKADTEPADEDEDAEFEAVRALVAAAESAAQSDRQDETDDDAAHDQLDAEPPVPAEDGPEPGADGDHADLEVTAAEPAQAAEVVEEPAPQETPTEPEPAVEPAEAAGTAPEAEAEPAEADRQPAAKAKTKTKDVVGEEDPAPETAAGEEPCEAPETESEPTVELAETEEVDLPAEAPEAVGEAEPAVEAAAREESRAETQSVEAEPVSTGEADTDEPEPEPEASEPEPESEPEAPEPEPEPAAAPEPEAAGGEMQGGDAEAAEAEEEQDGGATPVAAQEQDTPDVPAEEADAAPAAEASERSDGPCDDAVVRSLMDVLITPAGVVQPQERAFAADLLLHIMDYATDDARHMLCDRLAKMPDAPAALVSRFVKDGDLEISSTLLLEASCVSDSELVSVVESGDHARALLVAQRRHLSAAVGTALAKTGDLELSLELVRNKHVQLGREALERLSALAREHDELLDPLVMRPDMSAACALDLFWEMTAKQRAYALGRFLAEVQVLPQILVMGKPGADLVAAALRSGDGNADGQHDEKPAKKKAAALVEGLEAGDGQDLQSRIVDCADVEPRTAERIVADSGGEALVVVCKALGVSRFAFGGALEKWQTANGHAPTSEAMQILFDTLSFRQARMALTYWDWQVLKVGPYAAEGSS